MAKIFEDFFMDIQADMVFACKDYVNGYADKIYVYGSFEGRMIASDYFFEIDGQVIERHKINTISPKYDVSTQRQSSCLQILNNDIDELIDLCKKYNRPMPTEIKMIYDVEKNSLDVNYKYEPVYSNHRTKLPDDVVDEWFEEIRNSNKL